MTKVKVAVVGLGKMGLSHLSMIRAHPDVDLVGVCDSTGYLLDVLSKYTGIRAFGDYDVLLAEARPDAVIIATPSNLHAPMVRAALEQGIHVFCEKPLFLDVRDGVELTDLADRRGLVTQVGYHNRYVGTFHETKRLLELGALGTVTNALAEAYGPVVLKPAGHTWRSRRSSGGGCLYDYAAHPLDLLTWYLGEPRFVGGSKLTRIFSKETDDAVASTLHFDGNLTAQLSANWSDESKRKMTTSVSLWGTGGQIEVDRQTLRVYLRGNTPVPEGYQKGWNVRNTTELTEATWFYLRGEEYSAQLDEFVRRVADGRMDGRNTFATASVTDRTIAKIVADAERGAAELSLSATSGPDSSSRSALGATASQGGTTIMRTQRAQAGRLGPRVRRAVDGARASARGRWSR